MAVVVDANLLVSVATDDARAETISDRLARWAVADETLHAPALMRYEAASALTGLAAAGHITGESISKGWAAIEQVPITYHPLEDGPAVVELALKLGRRSAYDAAYVALAQRLGADLWTLDGPLARNAAGHGLPVRLLGTGS